MASERPPFAVDAETFDVLTRLWESGYAAYLVGGGVRDALLGLAVEDWDVATDARPERLLELFPGSTYENRFGTVLARGVEVTTFRREHRYADHRRPDSVTFSDDLYEDLARRDLTVNAIAWGRRGLDAAPQFVDPADGRGDLATGLVRAVGDPGRRFDEDALRLLRAVRIAARLDFAIEPVTRGAMEDHAADIEWVSEERISTELRRMLASPAPSRAIRLMRETGILATTLPELDALGDAAYQRAMRTIDAVAGATKDEAADEETTTEPAAEDRLALAALLAETGPATTRAVLERLRVAGRLVENVTALVDATGADYRADWSDADVRRYMARVGAALLEDLLSLRRARAIAADAAASTDPAVSIAAPAFISASVREAELRERIHAQRAAGSPLMLADLAVDGDDLQEALGIPEGPVIGTILERLLDDVIGDPAKNSRPALLARAGRLLEAVALREDGSAGGPAME